MAFITNYYYMGLKNKTSEFDYLKKFYSYERAR